jgi:hypothetical protein
VLWEETGQPVIPAIMPGMSDLLRPALLLEEKASKLAPGELRRAYLLDGPRCPAARHRAVGSRICGGASWNAR